MSLNESKGNMYEFITHTWNTVKGECPHGCSYCYMHRFGKQRPVRFDAKELKTDLGEGNFIFVGSSCDMFAESIDDVWIDKTLKKCREHDNSYLFQSKDPQGIHYYSNFLPAKTVICTTIETNRWYPKIMVRSPRPEYRAYWMNALRDHSRYVTIEPVMDFDLRELVDLISKCEPVQVNIGADSGNNHLPEPPAEKILALIDELKKFTTIANKRNLTRIIGGELS